MATTTPYPVIMILMEVEAQRIVKWILSLAAPQSNSQRKCLPAQGVIAAKPPFDDGSCILRITAQYANDPNSGIRPLTGVETTDLKLVK